MSSAALKCVVRIAKVVKDIPLSICPSFSPPAAHTTPILLQRPVVWSRAEIWGFQLLWWKQVPQQDLFRCRWPSLRLANSCGDSLSYQTPFPFSCLILGFCLKVKFQRNSHLRRKSANGPNKFTIFSKGHSVVCGFDILILFAQRERETKSAE